MTTTVVVSAIIETYRVTVSFDERVNLFLDQLNEAKSAYNELNDEWRSLNELIEDYISECHSKDDLTTLFLTIEGLIKTGDDVFKRLVAANLAKVLPSVLTDIEDNLNHIKEIKSDIKMKISDLPELLEAEQNLIELGF